MESNFIETLRDCANALGDLLPHDHAYRSVLDRANRILDRYDLASSEQRTNDALRNLISVLPSDTQTSMMVFRR